MCFFLPRRVDSRRCCIWSTLFVAVATLEDRKLCCHREAARCFVSVCRRICLSIVQYLERSLSLLVTSASGLPMRTIKLCLVLFSVPVDPCCHKQASLMRDKQTPLLSAINYSTVENVDDTRTPTVIDPKARCWSKITILPQLGSSRRNIAVTFVMEKLERCGYPMVKKFEDTTTRFDTMHERDGRTNGRTPHDGIGRAYMTASYQGSFPVAMVKYCHGVDARAMTRTVCTVERFGVVVVERRSLYLSLLQCLSEGRLVYQSPIRRVHYTHPCQSQT